MSADSMCVRLPSINLSPRPVLGSNGQVKLSELDNHAMGTIFDELIRKFNEENNEEAGQGESNIRRWIIENDGLRRLSPYH